MAQNAPGQGKRGRRSAELESGREVLLRNALACFAQYGYEGTSLRTLGAEAGVDMALVARLFGSKAALWEATVERLGELLAKWTVTIEQIAEVSRTSPRDGMVRLINAIADISVDIPTLPPFLLHEVGNPGQRFEILIGRLVTPFRALCLPIVGAAIDCGVVRGKSPDLVLGMILAAISMPIASPEIYTSKPRSITRLRNALVDEAILLCMTET